MTSAVRSGVVAVILLLGLNGCIQFGLKTPVGDPENGWSDPRISGVWAGPAVGSSGFWVFEPFNAKAWLVIAVELKRGTASKPSGKQPGENTSSTPSSAPEVRPGESSTSQRLDPGQLLRSVTAGRITVGVISVFKGWLTSLGDRRYLVLEPMADLSSKHGFKPPEWLVFHARLRGDQLLLTWIKMDIDHLRDVTSRSRAERIIATHGRELDAGTEPLSLTRVSRAYYDFYRGILRTSGFAVY